MSKLETEIKEKEWTNIDYTNTSAYKTVKAYNRAKVYHGKNHLNSPSEGEYQDKNSDNCNFLKLDTKIRKDKGPILKKITHMHRKAIPSYDHYGKKTEKEYLYFEGYMGGTTFSGEQEVRYFNEGYYKKPTVGKV